MNDELRLKDILDRMEYLYGDYGKLNNDTHAEWKELFLDTWRDMVKENRNKELGL